MHNLCGKKYKFVSKGNVQDLTGRRVKQFVNVAADIEEDDQPDHQAQNSEGNTPQSEIQAIEASIADQHSESKSVDVGQSSSSGQRQTSLVKRRFKRLPRLAFSRQFNRLARSTWVPLWYGC